MEFKSISKVSINVLLILFMSFLLLVTKGFACSVSVDDNYQKNLLAAHGASFFAVSLTSLNSLSVSAYAKTFVGTVALSDCPAYLASTARVTVTYSPKPIEKCTASVTVSMKEYMGDEVPTGPLQEIVTSAPEISCSTSKATPIPVRIPVKMSPIIRNVPPVLE